jgi:hypothetical protein
MDESNDTTSSILKCDLVDDLGYDLILMYRILFGISCITVPIGVLLSIVFVITIVFRAKKVFNIHNHALLLSCLAQVLLAVIQGPIRIYFYYNNGCLPEAGSPLCQLTVYLDYIPTQINDFLVAQLSVERFFLVVKPFIFHRGRHQSCSFATCRHYVGLFVAIVFPCLYYPIIMHNGAAGTIDLDDPSATQTCDLWYAFDIYDTFDLLITIVPYFLILTTCLSVIVVVLYRKCVLGGHQRRRVRTRRQQRLLLSLHLFLLWFLFTWSPWVLYDFFQTVLNFTYSVYIDAITTFIVYLNYTFSSALVLITVKEMRQFCCDKLGFRRGIRICGNHVVPIQTIDRMQTVGTIQTVRYATRNNRITGII